MLTLTTEGCEQNEKLKTISKVIRKAQDQSRGDLDVADTASHARSLEEQFTTMSYFFSTPLDIDIVLENTDERQMIDMKLDKNRKEKAPLYMDGESVKGAVTIRPKDGKRLEHTGIKVQFIGTIGIGDQILSFARGAKPGRHVVRPRQPLRIPVLGPGACCTWRSTAPTNVRIQFQKCREAI